MALQEALQAHLQTGLTMVARCWGIRRSDGLRYGFTEHDRDLAFEGFVFKAETGLTALAIEQATGLSIDNSEALGALSDAGITEADIEAGRLDGAEVTCWLVNWADVAERSLVFRGQIGALTRAGGAFRAELRGLSEMLNRPIGRVYQKPCTAVLGDAACGFDLDGAGYHALLTVEEVEEGRVFRWANLAGFEDGWFTRGALSLHSGEAAGLRGMIKRDAFEADGARVVELWEPIRASISAGDEVRLDAGCDKRFETCRLKFANQLNFRGFPDIPGEDWQMSYPKQSGVNTGGSLRG